MDLLKKAYEISIWEDNLIVECWPRKPIYINGQLYPINTKSISYEDAKLYCENNNVEFSEYFNAIKYYDEQKIAVIGSNTMDQPFQAIDAQFSKNVNGQKTLKFSVYYKYYDEETDQFVYNPYTSLLVNERKLKLNYDGEWYDFIIKNIDEDRDSYTLAITANDALINELSKTGFDITFDTELNNNIGTVEELAQTIIDGTEWELGTSDSLYERKDSVLYKIIISKDHSLIPLNPDEMEQQVHFTDVVYGFYNSVQKVLSGTSTKIQVIYSPTGQYKTDEDLHILEKLDNEEKYDAQQYYIENVSASELISTFRSISSNYRGLQLTEASDYIYDPIKEKVVEQYYDADGNTIYMYTSTKTSVSNIVTNILTNAENFANDENWYAPGNMVATRSIYPGTDQIKLGKFHNFLRIDGVEESDYKEIVNSSVVTNFPYSDGLSVGQKYVFRTSLSQIVDDAYLDAHDKIASVMIRDYKYDDGNFKFFESSKESSFLGNIYVNMPLSDGWYDAYKDSGRFVIYSGVSFEEGVEYYTREFDEAADDYIYTLYSGEYDPTQSYYYKSVASPFFYTIGECTKSISYSQMLSGLRYADDGTSFYGWKIGLFIQFENSSESYYLESAQLFPYEKDDDGRICLIGSVPKTSSTKLYNYYYKPTDESLEADDVELIYSGPDQQDYTKISAEGLKKYEKRRTVSGKQSNRFNLLQSLCETFECWASFSVDRDSSGKILKSYIQDSDGVNYQVRRNKQIEFLEYIGRDDRPGFVYGINLGTISRTLASDEIVTKLIVQQNSNEYANNGFCTIARAEENDNSSTFILNMDYYIKQGMLDYNEWIEDLYSEDENSGALGYYTKLSELMEDYSTALTNYTLAATTVNHVDSEYETYSDLVSSSTTELSNVKKNCATYVKTTLDDTPWETILQTLQTGDYASDDKAQELVTQYYLYEQNIAYFTPYVESLSFELNQAKGKVTQFKQEQEYKKSVIEELDAQFYRKYNHIIQEGSWIDEDYIDDNLYYLDGLEVLYASAFPAVSYNINVYEISEIEDFENYTYDIGDRTYVEDTEFFGYVTGEDGILTPYREEIVVSETLTYLDSPEKNTITVQNYKTQFEDLFQRITATTQSLQYSSGKYSRAANAINSDGTIDSTVLSKSIEGVDFTICNPKRQTIIWDSDGISSLDSGGNMIRISTGSVKLSRDGGETWGTAIDANGINTAELTAGVINTEDMIICNGTRPTFQWNRFGLTAYAQPNLSYAFDEDTLNITYASEGDFTLDEENAALVIADTVDLSIQDESIYLDGVYSQELRSFVRFDWNGLYGVPNGSFTDPAIWTPSSMAELQEEASFGLIWNEFFLKSDNHGGMVKISSRNDIQVLGSQNNERIKIGRLNNLEGDDAIYGIRIRDNNGNSVMETGSDGKLWLKNTLSVGDGINTSVLIGYNAAKVREGTAYHEIINANDNFIVYEDGHVIAKSGYIGDLTVAEIQQIESNANYYTDQEVTAAIELFDDTLTQTELHKRLMNNVLDGAIIKNGTSIYLNATYINNGTLNLGGENSVSLEVRDSENVLIGSWSSSGILAKKGLVNLIGDTISDSTKLNVSFTDGATTYLTGIAADGLKSSIGATKATIGASSTLLSEVKLIADTNNTEVVIEANGNNDESPRYSKMTLSANGDTTTITEKLVSTDSLTLNGDPLNDFVIAQETSGDWNLRTWSSNYFEGIQSKTVSISADDWTQSYGLYSYTFYLNKPENTRIDNVNISCKEGLWIGAVANDGRAQVTCFVNDNTTEFNDLNVVVSIIGQKIV